MFQSCLAADARVGLFAAKSPRRPPSPVANCQPFSLAKNRSAESFTTESTEITKNGAKTVLFIAVTGIACGLRVLRVGLDRDRRFWRAPPVHTAVPEDSVRRYRVNGIVRFAVL